MKGQKFLVTAGPTIEKIDPVRFLSNHSTGKMGYAVASELASRGAEVTLVSGPTHLPTPAGVRRIDVISAADMFRECVALWPLMDGAVMCAAVADYTPANPSATKLKKSDTELTIELTPTKDIAAELGRTKRKGQLLIGFALETDNEESNALGKLTRKNLDLIVLNSLRDAGAGFGHDTNRITILTPGRNADGDNISAQPTRTKYPLETKQQAANHIVEAIQLKIENELRNISHPERAQRRGIYLSS
jgi:phosphopantothenoylcysteine decarboxylase/phosphopantothenate--cysteine ligase